MSNVVVGGVGEAPAVEHPFAVGTDVSAHLHTPEDEHSIHTEREIGCRSGEREVVLGAGGYTTEPRGEPHAMWNAGSVPVRMIEIISPAGFEHFFRAIADLAATGGTEIANSIAIAVAQRSPEDADFAAVGGRHPRCPCVNRSGPALAGSSRYTDREIFPEGREGAGRHGKFRGAPWRCPAHGRRRTGTI
ncbi:MAG: cupin protein [Blastococcus sp.]|nr:cupin protein [Blastococcus sp.]